MSRLGYFQVPDSEAPPARENASKQNLVSNGAKLLLFPRLHTACDPFEIFKPCTLAIRRAVQLAHKTARIAHFFYEFLQRQLGVEIGLPQAVDGDIAEQAVS
jgi:hypothetical protein